MTEKMKSCLDAYICEKERKQYDQSCLTESSYRHVLEMEGILL